eukprot:m.310292 g.310292  ORF g.310292 m.310292 type:complete len:481 (-) comp24848_c0_seq1:82-1524(-)
MAASVIISAALLLAVLVATAAGWQRETVHSRAVSRIAFGSCAKQRLAQPVWGPIGAAQPDVWIWTGDAVYAKGASLAALRDALEDMCARPEYSEFVRTARRPKGTHTATAIVGTWDDHDFGINDARGTDERVAPALREQLFKAFLDSDCSPDTDLARDAGLPRGFEDLEEVQLGAAAPPPTGLYASHTFVNPDNEHERVRVILLDTRTFRERYVLETSLSHASGELAWYNPMRLHPAMACLLRFSCAWLGWFNTQADSLLGEEQWRWLEEQLKNSDNSATVNILVSSIQVLTENPFTESWGHFPEERRRLLRLLETTRPRGLVILSGDVHYAEVLGLRQQPPLAAGHDEDAANPSVLVPLEVTSSGLTHTCSRNAAGACGLIVRQFGSNRVGEAMIERNFGILDISWNNGSRDRYRADHCSPAFGVRVFRENGSVSDVGFERRECEDWLVQDRSTPLPAPPALLASRTTSTYSHFGSDDL